ncbi:MAG: hypothetical protein R3E88_12495 [Myxococcota bacterium]|nr:hypothetical protein [Myxococcales bacterium]
MTRLWQDYKLPIVIAAFGVVAGVAEVAVGPIERIAPDRVLEDVYPDSDRVRATAGVALAREGRVDEANEKLAAAFDRGYKESEDLYAAYVDVLVRTQSSRARIAEVVARWRRDYPRSERLASMSERLRRASVLP